VRPPVLEVELAPSDVERVVELVEPDSFSCPGA
jgi:hypothetical protein